MCVRNGPPFHPGWAILFSRYDCVVVHDDLNRLLDAAHDFGSRHGADAAEWVFVGTRDEARWCLNQTVPRDEWFRWYPRGSWFFSEREDRLLQDLGEEPEAWALDYRILVHETFVNAFNFAFRSAVFKQADCLLAGKNPAG